MYHIVILIFVSTYNIGSTSLGYSSTCICVSLKCVGFCPSWRPFVPVGLGGWLAAISE